MNILALVSDGFGGHGGIARYNACLLRALAASHAVRAVTVLPRLGCSDSGAIPRKVTQLTSIASRLTYTMRAARHALGRHHYDAVFCGHLHMAPLAAGLSWAMGVPLWLQVHGIEAWSRPSRSVCFAAERASLVSAVSRYTRHRLLGWAAIDPTRVKVLPNTFEPRFAPGPKPARLLASHDLIGRKVVLTVARLAAAERYKGHDRVIRALPAVLDKHPDAIYVIVGEGDDRPRLEVLVQRLGVTTAVRFLGLAPDEELPDVFRMADVFVMPSTGEGFGIVYLEAVAAGIPVIAGNRDGSVDALADGVLGTLLDPDNADDLVRAITAALTTPATPDRSLLSKFEVAAFNQQVDALVRYLR
jgi:phosphatidylinositol alpha-1,6-mannosyltransferase